MMTIPKPEPIRNMVEAGKQTLSRDNSVKSEHLKRWQGHMAKAIGGGILAAAAGAVAVMSVRKAMKAAKDQHEWKDKDRVLDDALASSLDASDAVATY